MSTANPRHHDAWLPVALEPLTWVVPAHCQVVRARLVDVDALAEVITDRFVDRRVVIDQAVDLRRLLLREAERARRTLASPGSAQDRPRRDEGRGRVDLGAFEAVRQARTARAVLAAALEASAGAVRPLAEALVDQGDLQHVAGRSATTCRRFLVLADRLATAVDSSYPPLASR